MRPSLHARGVIFSLLAVLSCAAGCTPLGEYLHNGFKVGPNYRRPTAPVADDWIDAGDKRIRTDDEDLCRWWTVLDDPTLDALVANAVQQNLTLREAGFRVLQARAIRAIAAGEFFPQQQDMFGAYSRNALSLRNLDNAFIPERFFSNWNGGFELAWELDFWGRFRRAIEAADADLDASVEEYDAVLVTLLGDAATAYVNIRTLQTQLALVRANVRLQQETYTIANARFRGGQVSELDVDQAESTLAQTEALVPQLEAQLRVANNQLCVLLGIPPEDLEKTIGEGAIPTAPAEVAAGIPADLLVRRPDVRRAERLVAAQSARVGVATSELYPHIAVTGAIGVDSNELSSLFTSNSMFGSAGPSFQWNLLNYGRLLNNIRLHDARLAELIVVYQNQVLTANAEVENGLVQFLRSQERAKSLEKSVDAAARAAKIAVVQYRAGIVDFNRVALIEQNLVQQQDLYAQAQGDIALGLIATYRALGGGWQIRLEPMPGPVAIPLPAPPTPPEEILLVPEPSGAKDANPPRLEPADEKRPQAVPEPNANEPKAKLRNPADANDVLPPPMELEENEQPALPALPEPPQDEQNKDEVEGGKKNKMASGPALRMAIRD